MTSPIVTRWRTAPRALKWGLAFLAFIALYFGAIEPAVNSLNELNLKADNLAKDLREKAKVREETAGAARLVEQATGFFGRPTLPETQKDRQARLERRVNQIFSAHKVSGQRTQYRDPSPLSGDTPKALAPAGRRLDKLIVELSFETDTETLAAIVRELESAPEIATISRVQLRRQSGGRNRSNEIGPLPVTLTAEAWATSPVAPSARTARTGSDRLGGEG
ncbi:MAG: GspMb/PilO family protein [Phycisphaerales bacterium]